MQINNFSNNINFTGLKNKTTPTAQNDINEKVAFTAIPKPKTAKPNQLKNALITTGLAGAGLASLIIFKKPITTGLKGLAAEPWAKPVTSFVAGLIDNHLGKTKNWVLTETNSRNIFSQANKNSDSLYRGVRPVSTKWLYFNRDLLKFSKEETVFTNVKNLVTTIIKDPLILFKNTNAKNGVHNETVMAKLKESGVKTIVDFTHANKTVADREAAMAESLGIKYVNIPLAALVNPKPEEIKKFFSTIAEGKTYCHCLDGKDRTGVMSAIYDIVVDDIKPKTPEFAKLKENMESYGHNPAHFPNLGKFLESFAGDEEFVPLKTELKEILQKGKQPVVK
ncbi:MAG: tyrosine-protein phosphatase [bacterium]